MTDLFKGLPVPDLFKQPWSFQALGSSEEREAISETDELIEGETLDRGTNELLELRKALEDYRVDD